MSTRALVDAVADVDLLAPSLLPGWSRLTIVCHLRYGAEAMRRMTIDALEGRRTAYYPEGRATQRPGTLEPRDGESPADVVQSLEDASAALDRTWSTLTDEWRTLVQEPDDNFDLGAYPLFDMPIFRLTEVEVHGVDLDVGLPDWSDVLIDHGLPMRLNRLAARTPQAPGAWRLIAIDGRNVGVELVVGDLLAEPEEIRATCRQLFALTLGRANLSESFSRAYPGP